MAIQIALENTMWGEKGKRLNDSIPFLYIKIYAHETTKNTQ